MYLNKHCRRVMNLMFLIPQAPGLGVWQCDTSSFHSIVNTNSMIKLLKGMFGRCSMIPLTMFLGPIEVSPEGQKRKTVHVLQFKLETMRLADVARLALLPPARALMPAPAETEEPPDDLFPREVLDGTPLVVDEDGVIHSPPRPTPGEQQAPPQSPPQTPSPQQAPPQQPQSQSKAPPEKRGRGRPRRDQQQQRPGEQKPGQGKPGLPIPPHNIPPATGAEDIKPTEMDVFVLAQERLGKEAWDSWVAPKMQELFQTTKFDSLDVPQRNILVSAIDAEGMRRRMGTVMPPQQPPAKPAPQKPPEDQKKREELKKDLQQILKGKGRSREESIDWVRTAFGLTSTDTPVTEQLTLEQLGQAIEKARALAPKLLNDNEEPMF